MLAPALLRTPSPFRALWSARTISFIGDTVATTALLQYAYETTGNGAAVSWVLLAQALPRLFGPVAGSLVDRRDQRRLMLGCDLGQLVVFTIVALVLPPLPVLLGLIAVAALLATLFAPAGRSVLPALIGQNDLPAANSLLNAGVNTGVALGPLLGGSLFALLGLRGALLANTCSFLVSALLLSRLPALPPVAPAGAAVPSVWATTRSGLRYVQQHRTARAVAIGLFLVVVFAALDDVAVTALVNEVFQQGALGLGVLRSVYGVAMIVGPLAVLRWSTTRSPELVLVGGTALLGVGATLTGLAPVFAVAVLAQSAAGLGNGLENVGTDTLIQRTVPRAMLGRVFGIVYAGASVAAAVVYLIGGPLLNVTSPRTLFVLGGAGVLIGLVVLWLLLPRSSDKVDHAVPS